MCQETNTKIKLVCDNLAFFLEQKNNKYGNSAIAPVRIFSKADPDAQIYCRIDDKLSRVKNSAELRKNDVVDLIGYLVLVCVMKDWISFKEMLD